MRWAALVLGLWCSSATAAEWQEVHNEGGIQVWQRTVPGSSFLEFKGKGRVNAGIKKVLAVLQDSQRKTEWMESCVDNRDLRVFGVGRRRVYNRTGSPFPLVSDRDVVVETKIDIDLTNKKLTIMAWNVADPLAPEVEGVVRMPKLLLTWEVVAISENVTEVTYQVQADPGGSLPAWVVNLASKKIPQKTIAKLGTQVAEEYAEALAVVESSFDWQALGL